MESIIDLTGRKILVTGASSGIGRATSILLSRIGAAVALVARNEAMLADTINSMDNRSSHCYYICDLTQLDEIPILMNCITGADGKKLNGFVHCAGVGTVTPIQTINPKIAEKIMSLNFYSFLLLTKELAKKRNCTDGSIVGISSIGAHKPQKCLSLYSGSKMALEGAVTALAPELKPKGIRINAIVAGATDTHMMDNFIEHNDELKELIRNFPMAKPGDIANAIAFLLSEASSTITGGHYFVNGGYL